MTGSAWPRELAAILREIRLPAPPTDVHPLQLRLRDHLYIRGFSRPTAALAAGGPRATTPGLVRRLSAANQGRDTWLPGWRVEEIGAEGKAVLSLGRNRRAVEAGDYTLTFSQDLPPGIGCAATLCHRRESLTLQAGVYYAFGDDLPAPEGEAHAVRVYLHAPHDS